MIKNNIDSNMTLRVSGFAKESIVDGFGIRYTIFTQGCQHKCIGCHNPETHDMLGGQIMNITDILSDVIKNPLLSGVTYSGGEPLLQPKPLLNLTKMLLPHNLRPIIYTGYTFEQLLKMKNTDITNLLSLSEFLIDGKFEIEKRDLTLQFRGSSNQRLIDLQQSMKKKKAVLYNE